MVDSTTTDQWAREGYVVARSLFGVDVCASLLKISEGCLRQWRECSPETGEAGGVDATSMRHLNHPEYHRQDRTGQVSLLEAAADPGVLELGRAILGEEILFRCTSLFMNPLETGKDGNWHRDSQFQHRDVQEEERVVCSLGERGNSFQLQVALVPSDDVEVVPGSHLRWDTPQEFAIRHADEQRHNRSNEMPGALRLDLAPGDGAAFNPFSLHRGRYHADRLRRTLMLTYTRASKPRFDYFSDQPWFLEKGYLNGLSSSAAAFYQRFIEQYRGDWAKSETAQDSD